MLILGPAWTSSFTYSPWGLNAVASVPSSCSNTQRVAAYTEASRCFPNLAVSKSYSDEDSDDDDDVSQHLFLVNSNNNQTTTQPPKRKGYQRIEDWHETNHNPTHTIDHLKREKARWKATFHNLDGGAGI